MRHLAIKDTDNIPMEGVLLINKPIGYTSHDIVAKIRNLIKIKKVGHLGTLDPMATGLLPLVLGRATMLSRFLMEGKKRYIAWIHLGFSTNTYDIEGEKSPCSFKENLNKEIVKKYLKTLEGKISQQPPPFSAKKYKGEKLYSFARKGQMIKIAPKEVEIHSIRLLRFNDNELCLDIECSTGTYIRSLAHDLGQMLGCGAYLSSLIRIESSSFRLDDALTLEEIELLLRKKKLEKRIVPLSKILNNLPSLNLPPSYSSSLYRKAKGEKKHFTFPISPSAKKGYYRLLSQQGKILAIVKAAETLKNGKHYLKPEIIFT